MPCVLVLLARLRLTYDLSVVHTSVLLVGCYSNTSVLTACEARGVLVSPDPTPSVGGSGSGWGLGSGSLVVHMDVAFMSCSLRVVGHAVAKAHFSFAINSQTKPPKEL